MNFVRMQSNDQNPEGSREEKLAQIEKDDHTLDPYEIEFLPQFREGRGPEKPFVNKYGVIIGDHMYDSPDSPLNQWSKDTDPAIMSGDEWVHPFKDIGFHTTENRNWFERGIPPNGGIFMHKDRDVSYGIAKNDEVKTDEVITDDVNDDAKE